MCGIFCSISRRAHITPSPAVQGLLRSRGPDAQRKVDITHHGWTQDEPQPAFVTCYSTVLSLRGEGVVAQPFQRADSNSALCWNGEAWSVRGERPIGNDTADIFKLLSRACNQPESHQDSDTMLARVARALSQVAGPYAFVYHDELSSRVFFGRDFLGRRSLLWSVSAQGDLTLCSVTDALPGETWSEVEADGIYSLDLSKTSATLHAPSSQPRQYGDFAVTKVPYNFAGQNSDYQDSVGTRYMPMRTPAHGEVLPELSLSRKLSSDIKPLDENSSSVSTFEALLRESLSMRVSNLPDPHRPSSKFDGSPQARLGILFSGGLDCTTLARLSHDILPLTEPIDLLNVAFENPRIHKSHTAAPFELCPDRITARQSLAELQHVCPERQWRLYTIDVPYHELVASREEIERLLHPHNTEMDFSIASALFFAARGQGDVVFERGAKPVYNTCPSRVLLSGLGADELFAGYTRHATAFSRRGVEGLLDELDLDIARLGRRNLGRDDRVISTWGREARFPFLDEKLVAWALSAPVSEKCGFGIESDRQLTPQDSCASIEPGKKVLRCLAWKLGMKMVAKEKKRAIQFGARTAKMESGKTKGTTLLS